VVVGHDNVFEASTEVYPAPAGCGVLVVPMGSDRCELIARIQDCEWALL
jgi:hypothetical protein